MPRRSRGIKKVIDIEQAEAKIQQIAEVIDQIIDDTTIPKNIRRDATEAKNILLNKNEAIDVRTATANAKFDEIVNDPNIPLHARTIVWNIISGLEGIC